MDKVVWYLKNKNKNFSKKDTNNYLRQLDSLTVV